MIDHRPVYSITPLEALYPEPELPKDGHLRLILVRNAGVIVKNTLAGVSIIQEGMLPAGITTGPLQYLGVKGDVPYYTAEVTADAVLPEGWTFSGVRELHGIVPDEDLALAAYAVRMADFDRSTRFCGSCGARTRPLRTERARFCSDCNRIVYPRLSPAIIVLVKKGDAVLLARSPRFPKGTQSILAGFVEPGENLEQAVQREVMEEVGIRVKNIRYLASEPWPFPDSLMIGFVADHAEGEIVIDPREIEEAGWYSRDSLPGLPSRQSISRALIQAWIEQKI